MFVRPTPVLEGEVHLIHGKLVISPGVYSWTELPEKGPDGGTLPRQNQEAIRKAKILHRAGKLEIKGEGVHHKAEPKRCAAAYCSEPVFNGDLCHHHWQKEVEALDAGDDSPVKRTRGKGKSRSKRRPKK